MSDHTVGIAKRVAELDAFEFEHYAMVAAAELAERGYCYVDLQPGDATTYKISIIRPFSFRLRNGGVAHMGGPSYQYHMATSFGPLYQWSPSDINEPSYVHSKWVSERSPTGEHTAHVIARFLDELWLAMKESE